MTRTTCTFDGLSIDDYRALLTGDVEDYHDADGRPIGELRAREAARRGVVTELRTCPYQGSRHHHARPMNQTALRQATRDWPAILGAITRLRAEWMAARRLERLHLVDYGRLAQLTALLPAYLMFRAEAPRASGAVPPFAASIHKLVTGIVSVTQVVALDAIGRGLAPEAVVPTAGLLHEVAEQTGLLAGRGAEVCAGPPGMIDEVLRLYAEGGARTRADDGPLCDLIPDRAPFFRYAEAATDLSFLTFVLGLRLDQQARAARTTAPPAVAAALDEGRPAALAAARLRHLGELPDEVREAVVRVLLALIRDLEAGERAVLAVPGGQVAARPLDAIRALEVTALGAIERQRGAIHAGLGRPAAPRGLRLAELEQLFGRSPSSVLTGTA